MTSASRKPSLLLRGRVLACSLLLAFQPLHVALLPRVGAFGHKAREDLRANLVHKSFLSPLPKHARLPPPGLLMAMLAGCQITELSAGLGGGYGPACILQGLPAPMGQGLRLAVEDFLCHLRDGLILFHTILLLPNGRSPPARDTRTAPSAHRRKARRGRRSRDFPTFSRSCQPILAGAH